MVVIFTGCKLVCQFLLHAKTVHHTSLSMRQSVIPFILPRLLCVINSSLPRLHDSASCETVSRKQNHADSLGRKPFLKKVVLKGSKSLPTVLSEA